jgi:hypothetical protein
MNCTEMPFDTCEFLIVYYVKEVHLETTFLGACSRDILGVLSTAEQHMELLILLSIEERTDGSIPAGELKVKAPDFIKSLGVDQPASSISARGKQHYKVSRESQAENLVLVNISSSLK